MNRKGIEVLRDVSITLRDGEIVGVLGRNGAGKTTLLEAVAGILHPARGSITLDGRELAGLRPDVVSRSGLALVHERRELFWNMTVQENLALAARGAAWWWAGPPEKALAVAWEVFPALRKLRDRRAHSLSGGEQQMVALARALVSRPKVLLLDEPSLGLAPHLVEKACEQISTLGSSGISILLVEQNSDVALDVCTHVALLAEGTVISQGPTEVVMASQQVRTALFGVN